MSKERARRREERERESAVRAAARAAEQERRERSQRRKQSLTRRLPRLRSGQPTGILARRRRNRLTVVGCLLVAVNVLLWIVSPDWAARFGGAVVSVLAAPVLYTLLFRD